MQLKNISKCNSNITIQVNILLFITIISLLQGTPEAQAPQSPTHLFFDPPRPQQARNSLEIHQRARQHNHNSNTGKENVA